MPELPEVETSRRGIEPGIFSCSGLEHLRSKAYTTPPLRILGLALRAYLSRFLPGDKVFTRRQRVGSQWSLLRWALKA